MQVIKTNQPATLGDLIHSEYDSTFTTEDVVLLAGSGAARVVPAFAVVSRVTASGKYQQIDFGGTGGVQTAAGVAVLGGTAPDATDDRLKILARGPVIVHAESLVWPSGATDAQKATATTALAALGIVARQGV